MDSVSLYMLVLAGVVIPPALFVWFMARRQRLEEEAAEDAQDAHGTAAE
jgi:hypothetical protein